MHTLRLRISFFALLAFALSSVGTAADFNPQNMFYDVRFPVFRANRLVTEIQAKEADAAGLSSATPRVDMKTVRILIYDKTFPLPEGSRILPPVRVEILGDTGSYLRARVDGNLEDIAVLKASANPQDDDLGNVKIIRYNKTLPGAKEYNTTIDSTMICKTARWNDSRGELFCKGRVIINKEGEKSSVITGDDLTYQIGDKNASRVGMDSEQTSDLGGKAQISRNVELVSTNKKPNGDLDIDNRMVVTSQGPALYDFDQRQINFSSNVLVMRSDIRMKSDFLEVILSEKDGTDTGQEIRKMTAWSQPGRLVNIEGKSGSSEDGAAPSTFKSKSSKAFFDSESNELYLEGDANSPVPKIVWELHSVTDMKLRLFLKGDKKLIATGGQGLMIVRSKNQAGLDGAAGGGGEKTTRITYKTRLDIDQLKHVAVFVGDVHLRNDELELDSHKLTVEFLEKEDAEKLKKKPGIKKLTAERDVELTTEDGKRVVGSLLTLTPNLALFPRPDSKGLILRDHVAMKDTPAPEVYIPGGGYFQAKMIIAERYAVSGENRVITRIMATGPGSGVFAKEQANPTAEDELIERPKAAAEDDTTTVRYSDKMLYDELSETVVFYGDVHATNKDQVLRSNRLIVHMSSPRILTPGAGTTRERKLKKLIAYGNAKMYWGTHHAEAERIDRDVSTDPLKNEDKVTLRGTENKLARIWEEKGSAFSGRTIIANTDGKRVFSNGGGVLIMNDQGKNRKVNVAYDGDALYTQEGDKGRAVFRKGVVLTRNNMTVKGDQMDVWLEQDPAVKSVSEKMESKEGVTSGQLPQKMRLAIVKGNVKIRQGKRSAFGSEGRMLVNNDGSETLTLFGSRGKSAKVYDDEGFRLRAPQVIVKESAGIIQATGPGDVHLETKDSDAGQSGPFDISYARLLVYNMIAKQIRLEQDVRMRQNDLRGVADSLLVKLEQGPQTFASDQTTEKMQIKHIETRGNVQFIKYMPNAPGPAVYGADGQYVLSRSDEAFYSPRKNSVLLNSINQQPAAYWLVMRNGMPTNEHIKKIDSKIVVDVKTLDISQSRQGQTLPIPPGELEVILKQIRMQ